MQVAHVVPFFRFINVSTLVTNEKGKELFRLYLETHKTSLALQSLKCYELAEQLFNDVYSRTDDNYDALKELMPAYVWETRLDDAIDANDDDVIKEYFKSLLEECKRLIEIHYDFKRFRKSLLDKLKRCSC